MAMLCIHICRFHVVCGWSSCVISNWAELRCNVGGNITGTGKWGVKKYFTQIISSASSQCKQAYLTFWKQSNTTLREILHRLAFGVEYFILFRMEFKLFLHHCVFVCVCDEWRVATGTDYVPVILFITVGAHGVSVADCMIYLHILEGNLKDFTPCFSQTKVGQISQRALKGWSHGETSS